jgi:hypothetical protein
MVDKSKRTFALMEDEQQPVTGKRRYAALETEPHCTDSSGQSSRSSRGTKCNRSILRRGIMIFVAVLLALGAVPALATHGGLPVTEGANVTWWDQQPDLVGTDIEFQERGGRTYAFVASMGVGFKIFDVTDGEHPALVGAHLSPGYQNDIQVQGNLAILSSDLPPYPGDPHHVVCDTCGVFEGIEVVDISNLALPTKLSDLFIDGGAHNSTLIGSVVYVSNPSRRAMDILDVSNPARPQMIKRIAEEAGCQTSPYPCQVIAPGEREWRPHDITALSMPDKGHRLYIGAIESTYILDVNDPHKVRAVSKIPNGDYTASYANIYISHQADPSPDGRLLVVSDERGGGLLETQCPGGGLHVYDITSEAKPKKLGVYFANDKRSGNCTAHNFRFLPDRNVVVSGWYTAGSWVIDMSGPPLDPTTEFDNSAEKPGQKTTWGRTLGYAVMTGADTWAAKSPGLTADGRLFMFTDDMARGMDTLEYFGSLPPAHKH